MFKYCIFLVAILTCSCDRLVSKEDKRQRELFKLIKIGMKKEDVLKILGPPPNKKVDTTDNNVEYFYYSHKAAIHFHSENPTIIFDSSGIVEFATYGDGE